MPRKSLNLLIDENLIQKARDHGLIISKFLENKLQEYFQFIDMVSKPQGLSQNNSMGLLRFERKSMAPEATRIPSYPTGPYCSQHKKKKQVKEFSVMQQALEVF
jgi:hypothetical protein